MQSLCRLEYSIDVDDCVKLALEHSITLDEVRRGIRKSAIVYSFLGALIVAAGLYLYSVTQELLPFVSALIVSTIFFQQASYTEQSIRKYLESQIRKSYDSSAGQNHLGRRLVTLDLVGFTVETPYVTTRYLWKGVSDMKTSEHYLYLTCPGPSLLAIPIAAFRDRDDCLRMVATIEPLLGSRL